MLRKVGESAWPISEKDAVVSIKDASYPIPFPQGLEFNSPAHGNWNIVHTGMLVPEARQIYVCADNCMRGVVLTAAEMNAADRFSFVIVEEKDLLGGNLEDVTIEGVTDILNRLDEIVFYKPLTKENIRGIVDLLVADLQKRMAQRQLTVTLTDAAKDYLIAKGYDPIYGARPLKRLIQTEVETLLARWIIAEDPAPETAITVDYDGEKLVAM